MSSLHCCRVCLGAEVSEAMEKAFAVVLDSNSQPSDLESDVLPLRHSSLRGQWKGLRRRKRQRRQVAKDARAGVTGEGLSNGREAWLTSSILTS